MSSRASHSPPLLTAVIVNHGQWPHVAKQLEMIAKDSSDRWSQAEWIVVDNSNAPAEDPPREVSEAVRVIRTANLGYGAAINEAARASQSQYLLALNADLGPEPGFLGEVIKFAEGLESASPSVGIAGFRLLDPDGSPQGSAGRFPTLARFLRGLARPRATRKYRMDLQGESRAEVDWVTGACMLIDRRCFDELGGFDEQFFLYYEDVDLCLRARQGNWSVVYEAAPACRHYNPYHSRLLTPRMVAFARRALLLYFWKHRPRAEFWGLRQIMRVEHAWRRGQPQWDMIDAVLKKLTAHPERDRIDLSMLPEEVV